MNPLPLMRSASALTLVTFALLSSIALPASATSPPPPPACPDIGASYRSVASLMEAVRTGQDEHARNCAADVLPLRSRSAHWAWIALMQDRDAAIQKFAVRRIHSQAEAAHDEATRDEAPLNLEQLGFPRSALRRFIELSAAQGNEDCGGGAGFVSDAGRDAVPVLSGLLAQTSPAKQQAAARCLGALGYQARAAAPLLVKKLAPRTDRFHGLGEPVAHLANVGIYTASDFDVLLARLSAGTVAGVPDIDNEDMAGFSVLPPAVLPRLLNAARQASTNAARESGDKRYFHDQYYDHYVWLAHALAATRTAPAVEVLIADHAYEFIPGAGPVAVPLLVARLSRTSDIDERVHIAHALDRIGTPAAVRAGRQEAERLLPALLADLQRPDPGFDLERARTSRRVPAIERFRVLGPLANPARPALLAMLEGRATERHYKAALVLGNLQAIEANARLIALRNQSRAPGDKDTGLAAGHKEETRVFNTAISALHAAPGYPASLTLEQLKVMASATEHSYEGLQPGAAVAELARRGPVAIPQLLALLEFWNTRYKRSLSSGDHLGQDDVLPALTAMGASANTAFAALVAYLNDPHLGFSLGRPGPTYLAHTGMRSDEGMERLFRQVIANRNEAGRYYSAQVLGDMGNLPRHMLAPLRAALKDKALWRHGGGPPDSLVYTLTGAHAPAPALSVPSSFDPIGLFLQQGHCRDRTWSGPGACDYLRQQGDAGIGAMLPILKHRDAALRVAASDYLGTLETRAARVAPELAGLLGDPASLVRRAAAENLGRILGPDRYSPALVGYLLKALGSNDQAEAMGAAVMLGEAKTLPSSSVAQLAAALRLPALQSFQEPLLTAIASTRSAPAATALVSYLRHAGSQTGRDNAVTALERNGSTALPVLLGAIQTETRHDETAALAAALAAQADPAARARAAAVGGRLLDEAVAAIDTLDTPAVWHIHTRRKGARRLAALMRFHPPARAVGMGALNNPDRQIVTTLINGLGEHGDPAVLPALAALRLSSSKPIKDAAGSAQAWIVQRPSPLERLHRCMGGDFRVETLERCRASVFKTSAEQD